MEDLLDSVENALDEFSEEKEKVKKVKDKLKEGSSKCRKALKKINFGLLCILSSGKASDFSSASANQVTVQVDETSTGNEM